MDDNLKYVPYVLASFTVFSIWFTIPSIGVRARGRGPAAPRPGRKAIIFRANAKIFRAEEASSQNEKKFYLLNEKCNSFRPARWSARNPFVNNNYWACMVTVSRTKQFWMTYSIIHNVNSFSSLITCYLVRLDLISSFFGRCRNIFPAKTAHAPYKNWL